MEKCASKVSKHTIPIQNLETGRGLKNVKKLYVGMVLNSVMWIGGGGGGGGAGGGGGSYWKYFCRLIFGKGVIWAKKYEKPLEKVFASIFQRFLPYYKVK